MTIVIALRRDEEILLMADTKVTDANSTGPNIIPGRLKIVTIGPRVSVAFAGNADPAGVALREARKELQHDGLVPAVEVLKQYSSDGTVDFLVAAHTPEISLLRLRRGVSLEVADVCTLRHDDPFREDIDRARVTHDSQSLAKSDLRSRFIDRLMTNRSDLGLHIGGIPICVSAASSGHRYLGQTGIYTYKFPPLKAGQETHQPIEQVYTGDGHFQLSVVPSDADDVPVVGVCLLQARTGYVFSPIEQPEAFVIPLAPPTLEWEGHEQQMFGTLKAAIATHVDTVSDG
ncbi:MULTISPECIES: hypothetical protein [unclassified Mesorhizobium]|uniref:hypothetical protein n=1 Tax=unclassified Mesorhizobium TaxID=325217 RepID=UPI0010425E95|nr:MULTISPECIES: hypothetical protein [unclassified Mesorhizobium]